MRPEMVWSAGERVASISYKTSSGGAAETARTVHNTRAAAPANRPHHEPLMPKVYQEVDSKVMFALVARVLPAVLQAGKVFC